jgi:hypothetical protein
MLRTLSIFQILEYNFVDIYITDNKTEKTPVHMTERRDAIAGFDLVEWICKLLSLLLFITATGKNIVFDHFVPMRGKSTSYSDRQTIRVSYPELVEDEQHPWTEYDVLSR